MRYFVCDPSSEDSRNHVEEQRNAEQQAQAAAAVDADLSAHLWTNQLLVHLAWIQRETKTSNRRWQEWVAIGLLASRADFVVLSVIFGNDINLDANEAVCDELSLFVLRFHRKPECLVVFELEVHAILLEVHLEVGLVYA